MNGGDRLAGRQASATRGASAPVPRWTPVARVAVVVLAATALTASARALLPPPHAYGSPQRYLSLGVQGALMVCVVLVAVRVLDRRPASALGLPGPARGWRPLLAGALAWYAAASAGLAVLLLTGAVPPLRDPAPALALVPVFAGTLLLHALPTELLFRGYVQTNLAGRLRGWTLLSVTAAIQTASLAAVLGPPGVTGAVAQFGLALALGYLRALSGNVWMGAAVLAATSTTVLLPAHVLTGGLMATLLIGVLPPAAVVAALHRIARRHPAWLGGGGPGARR